MTDKHVRQIYSQHDSVYNSELSSNAQYKTVDTGYLPFVSNLSLKAAIPKPL